MRSKRQQEVCFYTSSDLLSRERKCMGPLFTDTEENRLRGPGTLTFGGWRDEEYPAKETEQENPGRWEGTQVSPVA